MNSQFHSHSHLFRDRTIIDNLVFTPTPSSPIMTNKITLLANWLLSRVNIIPNMIIFTFFLHKNIFKTASTLNYWSSEPVRESSHLQGGRGRRFTSNLNIIKMSDSESGEASSEEGERDSPSKLRKPNWYQSIHHKQIIRIF